MSSEKYAAEPGVAEQSPAGRERRVRTLGGRVFGAVSWAVAAVLVVASVAWVFSSRSYIADLAANLSAQFLALTLVCGAVWAAARRWGLLAVAAMACASHVAVLSMGRAAYWPREPSASRPMGSSATTADASGVVRFFHYNANSKGNGQDIEQVMTAEGPDVISIVGPPVLEQSRVIYGHHLADRYAGKLTREWQAGLDGVATDVTPCFVVSRWPIRKWETSQLGPEGRYVVAGVVDRPGVGGKSGAFGLIAVHPRSPRTEYRWSRGNVVVEAVVKTALAMRAQGLAVIVLTDLNSTPTGYRSRRLYWGADLRRAKPLLDATGTYFRSIPMGRDANSPRLMRAYWPANVAIDDAVVSPEVEVVGWKAQEMLASEHRPILVDLRVPFAASNANPPDSGAP